MQIIVRIITTGGQLTMEVEGEYSIYQLYSKVVLGILEKNEILYQFEDIELLFNDMRLDINDEKTLQHYGIQKDDERIQVRVLPAPENAEDQVRGVRVPKDTSLFSAGRYFIQRLSMTAELLQIEKGINNDLTTENNELKEQAGAARRVLARVEVEHDRLARDNDRLVNEITGQQELARLLAAKRGFQQGQFGGSRKTKKRKGIQHGQGEKGEGKKGGRVKQRKEGENNFNITNK